MNELRINGYSTDAQGRLILNNDARPHTRLVALRIVAPRSVAERIVQAIDEPAALVGTSAAETVMLFGTNTPPAFAHDFVFEGKQCSLALVTEGTVDVSKFTWAKGRAPTEVHRNELPPLYVDQTERVTGYQFIVDLGGRWGLLNPPETPFERVGRERRERGEVAAAHKSQAELDAELVAKNPDLVGTDGTLGALVQQARARLRRFAEELQA